jgi:hypothetical protein
VGQWSVDEFGEDLLDHGVTSVLLLGLDKDERAVGERGVVAPHGEQVALGVDGGLVQVGDALHDQPGGDLVRGVLERGVGDLGDVGAGDEALLVVVPDRAAGR